MRKHFIKEWRRFRGITQEEMGDRLGLSKAAISRVESGAQGYSQKLLEEVARVLRCSPVDLIMRDPNDDNDFWGVAADLSDAERRQAVDLMNVLRKARGAANDR